MSMLEILNKFNYVPPTLKEWEEENIKVDFDDSKNGYGLFVNDESWMGYDPNTHFQATELFSHYSLAKGHCICTGMGLGVRENWLLRKDNVTKVTIVEKNEKVLEYHKHIQSPFLNECEVIIADASEYVGACDTLLLDHYEFEQSDYIFNNARSICNNIECETLWFWPLEKIIRVYRDVHFDFFGEIQSHQKIYEDIKAKTRLEKLPDLDGPTLDVYCFMFAFREFLGK